MVAQHKLPLSMQSVLFSSAQWMEVQTCIGTNVGTQRGFIADWPVIINYRAKEVYTK